MPDSERAITTAAAEAIRDTWHIDQTLGETAKVVIDAVRPLVVREEHARLRNQATAAFLNELDVLAEPSQYDPSVVRDARIAVVAMRRLLALLGESTQEQAGGPPTSEGVC